MLYALHSVLCSEDWFRCVLYTYVFMSVFFCFFCMSAIAHCSSDCTHRNFPIHNTNILPQPHNQDSHLKDRISHVLPEKYDIIVAQTGHHTDLYLISLNVKYTRYNLKQEHRQSRTDCVPSQTAIRGLFIKHTVLSCTQRGRKRSCGFQQHLLMRK